MRSRFALLAVSAVLLTAARDNAAEVVTPPIAVAPQYDTTHVYVDPADFDRFAVSFLATFGGTATKRVEVDVTPTPSSRVRCGVAVGPIQGCRIPTRRRCPGCM